MADLFTDIETAEQAAKDGMATAAAHAESSRPGWSESAYRFLCRFAAEHPGGFISEDVSDAAKLIGLSPHDDRAWGAIYRRAIKNGVIVQDGSGRSRRRHASICPRWKPA